MVEFSHSQKARYIVHEIKNEESDASAIDRATSEIGVQRTKLYALLGDKDAVLKKEESVQGLETAFRKRAAAPGTVAHRGLYADINQTFKGPKTYATVKLDRYLLDLSFDTWAPRALDKKRNPASRLLNGRLAEVVLFNARKMIANAPLAERSKTDISSRGIEVIEAMMDLIADHPDPPAGFFADELGGNARQPTRAAVTTAARSAGYRMFKIRMQSDQVGWHHDSAEDDQKRTDVAIKAFKAGLHADLAWLHSILGSDEIAWANGAWVLAIHAGDWTKSARYAVPLFAAFPCFLTEETMGMDRVCEDRTVWPGVAAILADRETPELDKLRRRIHQVVPAEMMEAIMKMLPAVVAGRPYLDVLSAGDAK